MASTWLADGSTNWRWAGIVLLVSALVGIGLCFVPVHWILIGLISMGILAYLVLNPDKIFYLAIFTIPFTDRVRVLPISFSLNDLVILFCAMVCVVHLIIKEQKVNFRTRLDFWVLTLSAMFFLAGFFSQNDTGLLGFSKIFEAFIVYYMTVYFIQTRQVTRAKVLKVVLWTALSQAALGIFQSLTGIGSDFQSSRGYLGYIGLGSNVVWHGRGTTWHFNTLGNYLATNYAIFLPLYVYCVKNKKRALLWAAILMLGIITTYSRGSLLGFLAATIYFLAVSQKTFKRSLVFVMAFLLCLLEPIIWTLANSSYVETLSYEERLIIWQVPLAAITSSIKALWLGSGLNSYAVVAWPFIPAWVPPDQYRNWFAHNFYLLTVVEVGLIGAAILFGFLAYVCVDALRQFKRLHGFRSAYGLSISVAIIAVFFVSIFDHTFASPHFKIFIFLLLGLLYAKQKPVLTDR